MRKYAITFAVAAVLGVLFAGRDLQAQLAPCKLSATPHINYVKATDNLVWYVDYRCGDVPAASRPGCGWHLIVKVYFNGLLMDQECWDEYNGCGAKGTHYDQQPGYKSWPGQGHYYARVDVYEGSCQYHSSTSPWLGAATTLWDIP